MTAGDNVRRATFCEWYTRKCDEDANFPFKTIWSDESKVTNNGDFNRRNAHYGSLENEHRNKELRFQHRFGFNMWCGIFGRRIIGPFIYNYALNQNNYLDLLQNNILPALINLPIAETQTCWFQQLKMLLEFGNI